MVSYILKNIQIACFKIRNELFRWVIIMSNIVPLKIYLIIQEKIITQTLQEFLTRLDYRVISLQAIDELLEIFKSDSQGNVLVICEESFFRGQERSVIRKIHKQYPNILYMVITENRPIFSLKEAISFGIYGYLHKPISLAELELLLVRLKEKARFKGDILN